MKKALSVLLTIPFLICSLPVFAKSIDELQSQRLGKKLEGTCLETIRKDFKCNSGETREEGCWCELNSYSAVAYVVSDGIVDVVMIAYNDGSDGPGVAYSEFAFRACSLIGVPMVDEEMRMSCANNLAVVLSSAGHIFIDDREDFDIFMTYMLTEDEDIVFFIAFLVKQNK